MRLALPRFRIVSIPPTAPRESPRQRMPRGRPPKPTAPLARDYLAGNSIQDVAKMHKVSTDLVRRALAIEGVERRPARQADPEHDLAIIRLRDLGLTWTEIAEATGIPSSTLQRHYAKATRAPASPPRRKAKELSPESLADMRKSGRTLGQIAAETGADRKTVSRHLRLAGLTVQVRQARPALVLSDEELRQRHATGETYKELAAICGVSPPSIWRRVNLRYRSGRSTPE